GKSRQYLAALDAVTGEATDWNPNPNGLCWPLVFRGNTVYVGGWGLSSVGGRTRHNIAALDARRGQATDWHPDADEAVSVLVRNGDKFLVGGSFSHISGQARSMLAEIDIKTGVATAWNPDVEGKVDDFTNKPNLRNLALEGRTLYIGGQFDHVGGLERNCLAA